MKYPKKWYIKQRDNPQLGTYYVACGQLSKAAARRQEGSLYGFNLMRPYETYQQYEKALADLKANGERIQS